MSEHKPPRPGAPGLPDSRPLAPVASYRPVAAADNPLPTGKYYPSNYEKRNSEKRAWASSHTGKPSFDHPPVPKHRLDASQPSSSSSRADSDAKRRLQQYQRDMIAQAQLAATEVLGGRSAAAAAADALPLDAVALGGPSVMRASGHRPVSPRLLPLGSPGPVTPIDLEGGDGYLSRGRAAADEAASRVLRAEEERRAHEGASPPVPSH